MNRSMLIACGAATATVAVTLAILWHSTQRGLIVTIHNYGKGALSSVSVTFPGGVHYCGALEVGERATFRIKPVSEGTVVITYVSAGGVSVTRDTDVYVEPRFNRKLLIEVRESGVTARRGKRDRFAY